MIDAHADPPLVVTEVVHAIRDGLAEFEFKEVMAFDFLGLALGLPLAAAILEDHASRNKSIYPIFLSYPVPKAVKPRFGLGAHASICSTM
jgi:hypothetical protein